MLVVRLYPVGMASVKLVLRKEQKADGTYPLAIRIIKDRKPSYIYLDYRIHINDWDEVTQWIKKSCANYKRLDNFLLKRLSEAKDSALEVETKKASATSTAIRQKIKPKATSGFFAQAQDYLDQLKRAGKYNRYTPEKPRIKHFKEFMKGQEIAFADINEGLLEKFEIWLKTTYKPKGKKKKRLSDRTIANHLVVIRSVFAHARRNEVIDEKTTYGKHGKKITFPETTKVPIAIEDVESLEALELDNPQHEHARKIWLFSFYFAGMRVSDLFRLNWSDFQDYRLHYTMGKNDKAGSLKIPDKAERILKYYEQFKENETDLVFPELKGVDLSDDWEVERKIAHKTSAIDKFLRKFVAPAAKINKPLTMHITRHTFADLAGDTIPIQMLQKLYRHSNVTTTINYQQNFIHKDADDALDAVLGKRSKPVPA